MHLYGEILERYVSRDLPSPTLAAIDAHVSNCLFCAHTLAEETAASNGWERRGLLGRLVRAEGQAATDSEVEEVRARAA
jgi:hypothetical protein